MLRLMLTFDDFDAWGDAVSGANLRLVCDSVENPAWTLGILDLGRVVVQIASEGGGNICFGANTHGGPILFIPLTFAREHLVNGEPLDEESLFAIPRGADFSICVRRRAHAWCSVALPADLHGPLGSLTASTRVTGSAGSVTRLVRLVQGIASTLVDRPAGTAGHRAAASDLIEAVTACLPAVPSQRTPLGRPRHDRAGIVRRVMQTIEAAPTIPSVADLAADVGVNGRTLLRSFRETYGVSPKQYLTLRSLHRIRRILSAGAPGDETVANVLVRNGIWEFGRFAGRYRRHFGELPSRTLQRARG